MRLVISGGLGHIGSRLLRTQSFLDPFDKIFIIDNLSTERYSSLFNLRGDGKFEFIPIDIRSIESSILGRIGEADAFIHLAAITNPTTLQGNPGKTLESNFESTKSAVDLAHKLHSDFFFASSTSVYSSQTGIVNEEQKILSTNSTYADVKLKEEEFILAANLRRSVIFRLGTIAGTSPGMRFHTAVNKFCFDASVHGWVNVWKGAIDLFRPYLSISDAVDAFKFSIINEQTKGTFNLSTCSLTVSQILNKISEILGKPIKIKEISSPFSPERNFVVDTSKITKTGLTLRNEIDTDIRETMGILEGINGQR